MILAVAIGFGVRLLADLPQAPWWGLLAGLLVAPLLPGRSCGLPRRRDGERPAGDEPGTGVS